MSDKMTVAIPKTLLCWLWGALVGALMATGIALLSFDAPRFRWWGLATFLPPLLSAVAAGIATSR